MTGGAVEVSIDVRAFHQEALVIDLHNDLLTKLTHARFDLSRRHAVKTSASGIDFSRSAVI